MFSALLGLILVATLQRVGHFDFRMTMKQLEAVPRSAFVVLVLLTALHVQLSNLKWRTVDAALRQSADSLPSTATSFAVTSAGAALGQVLPLQVSMTAARTVGTYFYDRTLKRGAMGTLFEQSFDILTVFCLVIASAFTYFNKGAERTWVTLAVLMTVLSLFAVAPAVRLMRGIASHYTFNTLPRLNRVLHGLSELQALGLLNSSLVRELMVISALRFLIQVLMAGQTAQATGAHIPLWHLAAALPFATISSLIAVTPGGLGIGDLSIAEALSLFGTPVAVGAQWALANRILLAAACLTVAACGAILAFIERTMASAKRALVQRKRIVSQVAPQQCNTADKSRALE